jgi:predicted ester cyclase
VAHAAVVMIGEHLRTGSITNSTGNHRKGQHMDSKADNISLVRRFLDKVVNGGRVELVNEIMAPGYVMRGGSLGTYEGRDAYTAFLKANAGGAFSEMKLDVLALVADADKVFVLFTNSGRNTGSFMGMPATGKAATWRGSALFRVEAGRIIESDYAEDLLMMFGQLGVTKLPEAKT